MTPRLLVLSAPSGGGKTTLARTLLATRPDVAYSVSATTRAPREGEVDGQAYHFLDRATFERRVQAGEFLEWAEYAGNRYGTLRDEVRRILAGGRHAVLDIEVQGARQVRRSFPDALLVFVVPPSAAILLERLQARGAMPPDVVQARLRTAVEELAAVGEYDFVVVNDRLDAAVAALGEALAGRGRRPGDPELAAMIRTMRRDLASAAGATAV